MERKDIYAELRAVDVSKWVEKKNNLSYLSWAHAVDQLQQRDSDAAWEFQWFPDTDGSGRTVPYLEMLGTYMIFCTVKAFGTQRTCQLPVLDYKNKPITAPTSMDINTSMMRCLAKTISLFGLGINLYAGEDLPLAASDAADGFIRDMQGARDMNELDEIASHVKDFVTTYPSFRNELMGAYGHRRDKLVGADAPVKEAKPGKGVAGLKQRLSSEG